MTVLRILNASPGMTVQDMGRPGWLAQGLSRGGATDPLALWEAAALAGLAEPAAVIEMAGMGGSFEVSAPTVIALTGAPMKASLEGTRLAWNATHLVEPGARLVIGGAERGTYGYLLAGGGIATEPKLGARGAHLTAGIGGPLQAGAELPLAKGGGQANLTLDVDARFDGGMVRLVPSLQTHLFTEAERARFEATTFRRDARGNRMGAKLVPDGEGFHTKAGLSILSEVIVPGDIQITGDGTPFVLLAECQTTGGYPRIGSVLPADLPRIAQAPAGAEIRFRFITLDEAVEAERREATRRAGLRSRRRPLVRDPARMHDLLSYQLISGVTAGDDLERT